MTLPSYAIWCCGKSIIPNSVQMIFMLNFMSHLKWRTWPSGKAIAGSYNFQRRWCPPQVCRQLDSDVNTLTLFQRLTLWAWLWLWAPIHSCMAVIGNLLINSSLDILLPHFLTFGTSSSLEKVNVLVPPKSLLTLHTKHCSNKVWTLSFVTAVFTTWTWISQDFMWEKSHNHHEQSSITSFHLMDLRCINCDLDLHWSWPFNSFQALVSAIYYLGCCYNSSRLSVTEKMQIFGGCERFITLDDILLTHSQSHQIHLKLSGDMVQAKDMDHGCI
jgi:hypothetical protein